MKRVYIDMDDTICDFMGPFRSGDFKLKYPQSKVGDIYFIGYITYYILSYIGYF